MNILAINCGSSSIKAELIDASRMHTLARLRIERLEEAEDLSTSARLRIDGEDIELPPALGSREALFTFGLEQLLAQRGEQSIVGVVHRVVHGGEQFVRPTLIDDEVEHALAELARLAPLHNPINLEGVRVAKAVLTELPQIAVFDTAYHATLPRRAKTYALPLSLAKKYQIRRYGFHGISHEYVTEQCAEHLGMDVRQLRIVTCHLGNGCSVAANEYGNCVETSMGFTPLEGLVMGTRCGDIDVGVAIELARREGLDFEQLDALLNRDSGILGISEKSSDMRDVLTAAAQGDSSCQLAVQVFCHRITKYIGAYTAVMGGIDAIVFTAGIGENSPEIRKRALQRLEFLGVVLDEDLNQKANLSRERPIAIVSAARSRVKVVVVATNEQVAMAKQAAQLLKREEQPDELIPIGVSGRHVHLTKETTEALFGAGYELTKLRDLQQPGQFAAKETVTVVGPRNHLEQVRILGPLRSQDQVEISRTDEFFLGIDAPVRESGNLENTPSCILRGPEGEVQLAQGVICAWRHIHMTPDDAQRFVVQDGDIVSVEISEGERALRFGGVLIRVSENYALEMHIDTDEANAAEVSTGMNATIVHQRG